MALESANFLRMRKHFGALLVISCVALLHSVPARASAQRVDELVQATLSLDADPKRGGRTFQKNCASCHGPAALGDAERAIPALAGQREAYLVKQLADFAEADRYSTKMHRVITQAQLKEPQMWTDVAAYLNALPVTRSAQKGSGARVALGEAIFREQCSSCHEEDARGDDDGFVPSLRNQHYSYLLRQMHGFVSGHRNNVDADLVRFIGSLTDEEVTAVTDYLSRFEGPVRERLKMRNNGVVGD